MVNQRWGKFNCVTEKFTPLCLKKLWTVSWLSSELFMAKSKRIIKTNIWNLLSITASRIQENKQAKILQDRSLHKTISNMDSIYLNYRKQRNVFINYIQNYYIFIFINIIISFHSYDSVNIYIAYFYDL